MEAYCQRQGVNLDEVRFTFDGENISSHMTPEDCEMEDGDVIYVYRILHINVVAVDGNELYFTYAADFALALPGRNA